MISSLSGIAFFIASASEGSHEGGPLFSIFGLEVDAHVTTMWAIMAILILLSWLATRNLKKEPKGLQNVMELAVDGLIGFFASILGKDRARKYLPFLGTMFLFILLSNYSGLIPGAGMLPGFTAPTNTWSVTLGLGIVGIIAVQVLAVQEKGWGHYKHLLQPWFLTPLNILEELVRPISLSLRLFGNIYGEEMVTMTLLSVVPFILPMATMLLGLVFGAIQAIIFTVLLAVYTATALETHESH